MANYQGFYESDTNQVIYSNFTVRIFDATEGNFTPITTSVEFDQPLLPEVFKSYVIIPSSSQLRLACPTRIRLRVAQLFLSDIRYLSVELPFRGGSLKFDEFFGQAKELEGVIELGLVGERIPPLELKQLCQNL